jgi:hypothetical protein
MYSHCLQQRRPVSARHDALKARDDGGRRRKRVERMRQRRRHVTTHDVARQSLDASLHQQLRDDGCHGNTAPGIDVERLPL